jgi:tripartite-type tricarboxylate transporter receptor subunit TctC
LDSGRLKLECQQTGEQALSNKQRSSGRPAPDEFTVYLKAETVKWGKLVREAGIRVN